MFIGSVSVIQMCVFLVSLFGIRFSQELDNYFSKRPRVWVLFVLSQALVTEYTELY